MSLSVNYDGQVDILYLAKEGQEERVIEIQPGVSLEMDVNGELIGVEIMQASKGLKEVLGPLMQKVAAEPN